MPHFFTLSNFSTATPRESSSVELQALWFEDPKNETRKKKQFTYSVERILSYQRWPTWVWQKLYGSYDSEHGYGDEPGDTWMLVSVLGKSTGCRLASRQVSTPRFHANVWNEHGDEKECGWEEDMAVKYVSEKLGSEICSWTTRVWRLKGKC